MNIQVQNDQTPTQNIQEDNKEERKVDKEGNVYMPPNQDSKPPKIPYTQDLVITQENDQEEEKTQEDILTKNL